MKLVLVAALDDRAESGAPSLCSDPCCDFSCLDTVNSDDGAAAPSPNESRLPSRRTRPVAIAYSINVATCDLSSVPAEIAPPSSATASSSAIERYANFSSRSSPNQARRMIGASFLAVIMQRFDGYAALDGGFA